LTRFVGRRREAAGIRQRLGETRLLTLTGPAGIGKTRLAAEVVSQLDEGRVGTPVWVDLASIASASLVPRTIASAVGMPEQPGLPVRQALAGFLSDRRCLLVLDNCEHLAAACAALVGDLLAQCEQLRFLVTSLQPLSLSGEMLYPVPALSLPTAAALAGLAAGAPVSPGTVADLETADAIALFLDRAAAVLPSFALTAENARAVAAICVRLDGLPLAIELAAAWVPVLTVDQIAALLDDRFTLLTTGQRVGTAARHQTLRAAMAWAFALLTPAEQRLLRRLSIFAAGWSLATAGAVCAGDGLDSAELLPVLSSLVDKSLVVADTRRAGDARYTLLESIRHYAAGELHASGESSRIRQRFLSCFLELVEEAAPKLAGPYQKMWLNWLAEEVDNVRAALSLAPESGQIETGLRIAIVFFQFWTIRDYVEEGLQWFDQLLARVDGTIAPAIGASAFAYASVLAGRRGHARRQRHYAEEASRLGEAAGDEGKPALAVATGALAWLAHRAGDHQRTFRLGLRQIELLRETGDPHDLGVTLTLFSFMAMSAGKYEEAHAVLDEGLQLLRKAGDTYRIAMALNYAGDLARCEGNNALAQSHYEESLALLRQIDAVRDEASVLHNLGHACLHRGEVERAEALFTESLALHQEQGNRAGMAECLLGFAGLAISRGAAAAGARLLAAAAQQQPPTTEWAATYQEYEHYLARARAALSERAFQREQATGRSFSLERAVAYAQEVARKATAARQALRQLDELTPREREVATLVAQARSNEEIAAELVISKRTVEKHMANIRAKLGFSSRSQLVRWAIQSGLVDPGDEAGPPAAHTAPRP
jgi:predicted ATPase/DNA-binding NarL/FixJ family response regulator